MPYAVIFYADAALPILFLHYPITQIYYYWYRSCGYNFTDRECAQSRIGIQMRRLTKILVGYDFRTGGKTALHSATTLATCCGAQLKLVHVVEPYPVYQQLSHPLTPPYTTEKLVQKAGEQLQRLVTTAEPGVARVKYEVRTGKPFVELILAHRAWQADLIVVGGPTQESGRFLGSTSERVLRKAMTPVLITKQPLSAGPKTVLVPSDFSTSAMQAAEEAVALVQHFGGRILFFHEYISQRSMLVAMSRC